MKYSIIVMKSVWVSVRSPRFSKISITIYTIIRLVDISRAILENSFVIYFLISFIFPVTP